MSHTFLALDTSLIPQPTKDNVPTYSQGYFSNDDSRLLIDGYDEEGFLVHPQSTFDTWLQWSENKIELQISLLSTAIEYTADEIKAARINSESMWYLEPSGDENA